MLRLLLAAIAALCLSGCADRATGDFRLLEIALPAAPGSMAPNLSRGPGGDVFVSWLEPWDGGHRLRLSRLEQGAWSEPRTITQGENWFVNWADFPSTIALSDDRLAAHWLVRSGAHPYAYDAHVALSGDQGRSWQELGPIHDDATQTEHGFLSFYAYDAGDGAQWPGLVWLDGRRMAGSADAPDSHHGGGAGMTLRHARIRPDGTVTEAIELDGLTCDCCQTAAADVEGEVLVAYRDRSEEEIRDIRLMRRADDGWRDEGYLFADGWEIHGCPVNGPAISAIGRRVVIAWFTAAAGVPKVRAGISSDGGRSFRFHELDAGRAIGRASAVVTGEGSAVAWLSEIDGEAGIRMQRYDRDGSAIGRPQTVVASDASRSSGFPRLLSAGDAYLLAWTDPAGGSTRARTALVRFSPD